MGQVRHGSATTMHAVRAAIPRSQASLAQLSRELGINPRKVAKWRKQATVEDMKTGPSEPRSTVLTEAEETMVVAFRRHTFLPTALGFVIHARLLTLRTAKKLYPLIERMRADVQAPGNLPISTSPNTDLVHRVPLELVAVVARAHVGLLASKLGGKASTNLGAPQTKPNHPWTNDQLRTHLGDFLAAHNFARRLKALGGLTSYVNICKIWTSEPDRFITDPIHQMPGLHT